MKKFAIVVAIALVAISFAGKHFTAVDLAQAVNGSDAINSHVATVTASK